MALIPQERHKQVALVVVLGSLAALWLFYDYWYSPRALEVEALEARLTQLEQQNQQAQFLAARGGARLEERLAVYERHVVRLEELIPRSEEVPALLNSMAMEAQRTGVDLASMRPEPAAAGEFYTRQSYQVSVVGDFHDVGRFLTGVASLARIVTPIGLDLEPHTGPAPRAEMVAPVIARFRIETYVLPANGQIPELPEELEG